MNIKFSKQAIDFLVLCIEQGRIFGKNTFILDLAGGIHNGDLSAAKTQQEVLFYKTPVGDEDESNGPLLSPTVYYTLTEHNQGAAFSAEYKKRLKALIEDGLEFNHLTVKQAVGMLDILNGRNQ